MIPWLIESPIYTNNLMNLENLSESLGLIICKDKPQLGHGLNLQVIKPSDSDKFLTFMKLFVQIGDSTSQGVIFGT